MSIESTPNIKFRSPSSWGPDVINSRWYDRMRPKNRHDKQERKHTEALLSSIVVTNSSQEQDQPVIVTEVVNQGNTNAEAALKALEKDFLHCYNSQMLALIAATHFQALQSNDILKAFFFKKLEEWVKKPAMHYGFFAMLATPKTDHPALETAEQKISYGVSCIQSLVSDVLNSTTSSSSYPTIRKINNEVEKHRNINAYTFSAKQCKVHQAVQKTSILGVLFSGNLVFSKESAFIREKVEATNNNPRFTPEELLYIAANSKLRKALKAELQRKTWNLLGTGKSVLNTHDIAGSELEQHVANLLSDETATRQAAIDTIKQHQYPASTQTLAVANINTATVYDDHSGTSNVTIHTLLTEATILTNQPNNNVSPVSTPRSSTAASSAIVEEYTDDEEITRINSLPSFSSQTSEAMVRTPASIRSTQYNAPESHANDIEEYFPSPATVTGERGSVLSVDEIDEHSSFSSPETVFGRPQDNQLNEDDLDFERSSFTSQRSDNEEIMTPQSIRGQTVYLNSNKSSSAGSNSAYGTPESIVGKLRDSDEAITPLSVGEKTATGKHYAKNLFNDFCNSGYSKDDDQERALVNSSPISITGRVGMTPG